MGNCFTCCKGGYVEITEDDSEEINAVSSRQDGNLGAELDMPPRRPPLQSYSRGSADNTLTAPSPNELYPDLQHNSPLNGLTMLPLKKEAGENLDTFPMIEVPNPNPVEGGEPTMYVFRPWTADDVRRAVEGIPHPKVKVLEFVAGVNGLIDSYRLNGLEVERAVRQILGTDWCMICGDWRSTDDNGQVLAPVDAVLIVRIQALLGRIQERYRARPDWTEVNRCIQKDDEDVDQYYHRLKEVFDNHSGVPPPQNMQNDSPYEQQLKNAFLKGCLPQISKFVTKHMVDHRTSRLYATQEYCRHAV